MPADVFGALHGVEGGQAQDGDDADDAAEGEDGDEGAALASGEFEFAEDRERHDGYDDVCYHVQGGGGEAVEEVSVTSAEGEMC